MVGPGLCPASNYCFCVRDPFFPICSYRHLTRAAAKSRIPKRGAGVFPAPTTTFFPVPGNYCLFPLRLLLRANPDSVSLLLESPRTRKTPPFCRAVDFSLFPLSCWSSYGIFFWCPGPGVPEQMLRWRLGQRPSELSLDAAIL